MRKASRLAGGLALAAMLASATTPAMADRGWYGGGHGGRGWGGHHDHVDGLGAFVGIAALFGAVAIIASSANKDAKANRPYQANTREPYRDNGRNDARSEEDAAVDDCAVAARSEASRDGDYAEVRGISGTQQTDKGWNVDGTVDQRRDGYSGTGETRRFSCTWTNGRVADVILSRDSIALR
ncbi:MAG: hypothetical protein JWQ16_1499 [Novosphingobium sp.]|nr:hypothetical protein [Novosphingobium sp.]